MPLQISDCKDLMNLMNDHFVYLISKKLTVVKKRNFQGWQMNVGK